MPHDKFLAAAHDTLHAQSQHIGLNVPARMPLPNPTPEPQPEPKAEEKKEPLKAKPASERPAPPTTLANVPASDPARAEGGRFSQVDDLLETDPQAAEKLLMRMSEEEREAFAASQ